VIAYATAGFTLLVGGLARLKAALSRRRQVRADAALDAELRRWAHTHGFAEPDGDDLSLAEALGRLAETHGLRERVPVRVLVRPLGRGLLVLGELADEAWKRRSVGVLFDDRLEAPALFQAPGSLLPPRAAALVAQVETYERSLPLWPARSAVR
jgi:hypothetical protein